MNTGNIFGKIYVIIFLLFILVIGFIGLFRKSKKKSKIKSKNGKRKEDYCSKDFPDSYPDDNFNRHNHNFEGGA